MNKEELKAKFEENPVAAIGAVGVALAGVAADRRRERDAGTSSLRPSGRLPHQEEGLSQRNGTRNGFQTFFLFEEIIR